MEVKGRAEPYAFTFDNVLPQDASQEDVFQSMAALLSFRVKSKL